MIPFNRASFAGDEQHYIARAVENMHISGDGPFSKRCRALLENELHVPGALLTTSCTHALEMAALLLNIEPGDEVLFPSFTFVSTVNAFVLRGAKPVFIDIREDTLNIDERLIEESITPKTKAVVVVHYAGVACEMDAITAICNRHNLALVEDNAHGLFGRYKGRYLGTFGRFATQSFHETKNFTCGEGGALLMTDAADVDRAEIIREKGTDRNRFFRGQVDKYTWIDVGSSYLPSDILAAFLLAQLEARERIQSVRKRLWETYDDALREWAASEGILQPYVPQDREQSYHMYYLLLPSLQDRQAFIAHLRARAITAVFHYLPLHRSAMAKALGSDGATCRVTDSVSDRLVRLPFYNALDEGEQRTVIEAVRSFHAAVPA